MNPLDQLADLDVGPQPAANAMGGPPKRLMGSTALASLGQQPFGPSAYASQPSSLPFDPGDNGTSFGKAGAAVAGLPAPDAAPPAPPAPPAPSLVPQPEKRSNILRNTLDAVQNVIDPEAYHARMAGDEQAIQTAHSTALALMKQMRTMPAEQRGQFLQAVAPHVAKGLNVPVQMVQQIAGNPTQLTDQMMDQNIAALSGSMGQPPEAPKPMTAYEQAQIANEQAKLKAPTKLGEKERLIGSDNKVLVDAAPDPLKPPTTNMDGTQQWNAQTQRWEEVPGAMGRYRQMHPEMDPNRITAYQQKQLDMEQKRLEASTGANGPKMNNVTSLRTQYLQQAKPYIDVRDAYQRMQSLSQQDSAAGDISLVFNYMKINDPGSTVREGEFATAQNAAGVPAQIANQYNKLMSGERLNPDQRKDFLSTAGRLYKGQEQTYLQNLNFYRGEAERNNVDPSAIQDLRIRDSLSGIHMDVPPNDPSLNVAMPGGQSAPQPQAPDVSNLRAQPGQPGMDAGKWDKRVDGSQKGNGWLGVLRRPDGSVSSEISVGLQMDGREVEMPVLVPTLSRPEVDQILQMNTQDPQFWQKLPPSVQQKVVSFAQQRMQQGKSPFAGPGESPGGQQSAPAKAPPPVGTVSKGHRYVGGDPASPQSWEPVQ